MSEQLKEDQTSYDNPWYYRGDVFTSDDIGDHFGFVYLITNTSTGKMYVGKKFFWTNKPYQKNGKKKKRKVESDWKNYYGSNERLLAETAEDRSVCFREILYLCKTRSQCAYYELREQVYRNVIFDDQYYNNYIGTRLNGNAIKPLEQADSLVIYTTEQCPFCTDLTDWLDRECFVYTKKIIGQDIDRGEFKKQWPTVDTVPHIVYNGMKINDPAELVNYSHMRAINNENVQT